MQDEDATGQEGGSCSGFGERPGGLVIRGASSREGGAPSPGAGWRGWAEGVTNPGRGAPQRSSPLKTTAPHLQDPHLPPGGTCCPKGASGRSRRAGQVGEPLLRSQRQGLEARTLKEGGRHSSPRRARRGRGAGGPGGPGEAARGPAAPGGPSPVSRPEAGFRPSLSSPPRPGPPKGWGPPESGQHPQHPPLPPAPAGPGPGLAVPAEGLPA